MRDDRLWQFLNEPRSAVGLGVFRIAWSLVLLGEISQLIWFRRLFFDPDSGHLPVRIDVLPLLIVWWIATFCMAVGWKTRWAAAINYVFSILTWGTFHLWEYHIDHVYMAVGLLLLAIPVERAVSIDHWITTRSSPREERHDATPTVPRLYYDALILVGIAIVYFDSVFHKLSTSMWRTGLAVWRSASLPHTTWLDVGWLMDERTLMIALSNVTLVLEFGFLLLMWSDRLRPWLFVVGIGLHLGIIVIYPIPWFGLAMMALYLLLVPDRSWIALARRLQRLRSGKTAAIRTSLPWNAYFSGTRPEPDRRSAVVGALVVFCLVCQMLQMSRAPAIKTLATALRCEWLREPLSLIARRHQPWMRAVCGATPHTVFLDHHFDNNDTVYTLVEVTDGRKTWLPMLDPSGRSRLGWSGRQWAFWSFRACGPGENRQRLVNGLRIATNWWRRSHEDGKQRTDYVIMKRTYDPYTGWSPGYYQRQLDKQWIPAGHVVWQDGKCRVTLEDECAVAKRPRTKTSLR